MKIFRGLRHPDIAPACALTIGNFDGVHRGHQAMLALLGGEAAQRGVLEMRALVYYLGFIAVWLALNAIWVGARKGG